LGRMKMKGVDSNVEEGREETKGNARIHSSCRGGFAHRETQRSKKLKRKNNWRGRKKEKAEFYECSLENKGTENGERERWTLPRTGGKILKEKARKSAGSPRGERLHIPMLLSQLGGVKDKEKKGSHIGNQVSVITIIKHLLFSHAWGGET